MRPRSIAGSLHVVLIASASCAAIASHARAQQATELPEVTVEARKKEVRTTNTRLEAGGTSGQGGVGRLWRLAGARRKHQLGGTDAQGPDWICVLRPLFPAKRFLRTPRVTPAR